MLENSLENKIFWNNFAHVKISCFTRILHHAKCHVNIKFYNIIFHKGKLLILHDWKPKIKLHVLIKNFAVWKFLCKMHFWAILQTIFHLAKSLIKTCNSTLGFHSCKISNFLSWEMILHNLIFTSDFAQCKILVKWDIFTCTKLFQNSSFSMSFSNM